MIEEYKKVPKKIYLVWIAPENEGEPGYFSQYDTVLDACSDNEGCEIFIANVKSIGKYKAVTKPVRIKKRKKRR